MNDGKNRNLRKSWSSASIAEEVNYYKNTEKKDKKHLKINFFPIEGLYRNNFAKNKLIVNPDSLIKVIWDVFILICLLIRAYLIPYCISFSIGMVNRSAPAILFTDIAFLADILVRLNTGYYLKGFLITNRVAIVKKYLKASFFLDLISSLPFEVFLTASQIMDWGEMWGVNFFRFVLLIKFIHLYRIKHTYYELEDRFASLQSITLVKFLQFSMLISLMVHWTACIAYVVYSRDLQFDGDLWATYIADESVQYLKYLYLLIYTVTTIGYFAMNVYTSDQKLLSILIMGCDIIIFAYILGKIQSTLDSYQHEDNETKRLLNKCKSFISQNGIPKGLRHKILKYVTFCRENERKSANKESEILVNLSLPLREEIFTQTRGFILAKHPVFKLYKPSFLKFIGYHLKLQIFGPQDLIFEEGENSSIVYFIQNGNVEIYHAKTNTTFKNLKKGKCFGEISFFLGTTRTSSAKSAGFTELLALNRSTMNTILASKPIEKNITDNIIECAESDGLAILHIRCYLCKVLGHIASNCKTYVISIDMKKIIRNMDNKTHNNTKTINLNDSFVFTFHRNDKNATLKNYNVCNTFGKQINVKKSYAGYKSLVKKALNFNRNLPAIITKKDKLSIFEENSSSSESEVSPLPKSMRYRNAFINKSLNRKGLREQKKAIECFDSELYPRICINPSELDNK